MQLAEKEDRLKRRNERIRSRFAFYTSKKHFSIDHTLELLSEEFLPLQKSTIWLIVSRTGYYKK